MPVDEILWKRSRLELINLLERTAERYEEMKKNMKKGNAMSRGENFYSAEDLDKKFSELKAKGFPIVRGKPPV